MEQKVNARRQDIIDSEALSSLVERTNRHGLRHLVLHGSALVFTGWMMATLPSPIDLLATLLYAILMVFLFCPLHESIHRSLFVSRWLNLAVGFVAGLILVLPPRFFRSFHMAHHRFTQLEGRDPELETAKPTTLIRYCWYVSGIPYAVSALRTLGRGFVGITDSFVPDGERSAVVREARIFVGIYSAAILASVATGSTVLLWYWLIPIIVGQPFLRMFLLAEHTDCDLVESMLDNTRTTWTNPVMRWLCWNMNYHTAHHAYAGVPFFRLAEVNELIRSHIRYTEQGYWRVQCNIIRRLTASNG